MTEEKTDSEESLSQSANSSEKNDQAINEGNNEKVIEQAKDKAEELIDLNTGEALTISEASYIMGASRTRVLVIAGAVESGKTTLIASLFHLFQKGIFEDFLFAGSNTLIGFDQRCHNVRTASGKSIANMPRTTKRENRIFLHLKVRDQNLNQSSNDLLISDLSGERYREAKDSIEECKKLSLIRRADHFILLIDGAKIIKPEMRQSAKSEASMLLRCCIDAEQLGKYSLVDIVFSKWDLIERSDDRAKHEDFAQLIHDSLLEKFEAKLGRLRFSKIVALRQKGKYDVGYGLDKLFPSWVQEIPEFVLPKSEIIKIPQLMSEFDRYYKRSLPERFEEVSR